MDVQQALLSLAIEPKTTADHEKLGVGLQKLLAEDPTFRVQTDPQTGQVIVSGMSELHLEIIVDRLKREFSVQATLGKPQVAYKEALTRAADGEMKLVLLEPIMRVEVVVPREYMGDVMGSLSSRRGQIQSQDDRGGTQIIQARVPLSELFGYTVDLRSRTHGRATFSMKFDRYEQRPGGGDDDERQSPVGAPRKPAPGVHDAAVALPEPDDDRR